MAQNILITGCSSGGKSTLIARLEASGHAVVHEPGLRVIKSGGPKPWEDLPKFVAAVTDMALADLEEARWQDGPLFFDRGLFDALSGKAQHDKVPFAQLLPQPFPYEEPVFYAPPWPEIFENTPDRQLSFETAKGEAIRLRRDLDQLGVHTIDLPRTSAEERTALVLKSLGLS